MPKLRRRAGRGGRRVRGGGAVGCGAGQGQLPGAMAARRNRSRSLQARASRPASTRAAPAVPRRCSLQAASCPAAARPRDHRLGPRAAHLYTSTRSSYSSSYSSGAMNSGVPSTLCGAVRERSMVASPRSPIFTTPSAGGAGAGWGGEG